MYKITFQGKRINSANYKTRQNARRFLRKALQGVNFYKVLGFGIRKA